MKNALLTLLLTSVCLGAADPDERGATKLMQFQRGESGNKPPPTYTSLDRPSAGSEAPVLPPGGLKFENASLNQVLAIYQELSSRTVIRASSLPNVLVTVQNQTPLTRRETLQALDTVLAENGIVMVPLGSKFVKAVAVPQVMSEVAPLVDLPPDQLPESSSYLIYMVHLKHRKPTEVIQALQPFASRLPNSIVAVKDANLLILRDYSVNVRRMLLVLEKIDRP